MANRTSARGRQRNAPIQRRGEFGRTCTRRRTRVRRAVQWTPKSPAREWGVPLPRTEVQLTHSRNRRANQHINQGGKPKFGGEKGDRTLDLRLMSPALYQLSYLAASNAVYDTIFYPLSSSTKLNFLLYPPINQKSAALLCTSYFKIKYAGNPITPSKPSIFLKSPTFSACNLMMEYFFQPPPRRRGTSLL